LTNLPHTHPDRSTADPRVTPDGAADFFDWDHAPRVLDQIGEYGQRERPELKELLLFPEFALGGHQAKRPKRENGSRRRHHTGVIRRRHYTGVIGASTGQI
jgi:hypothetical protein